MPQVKPIETRYKGYRFRSRLEARWAVFFDALGVAWEYEKEGYDLGDAGWYLPDFWLPESREWVEIKPDTEISEDTEDKCLALANATEHSVYLCRGVPTSPSLDGTGKTPIVAYHCWEQTGNSKGAGADPRAYWWHERMEDGSFLMWPVPSFEVIPDEDAEKYPIYAKVVMFISDILSVWVINPLWAGTKSVASPSLLRAYGSAKSARFERAETPQVGRR